MNYGFELDPGEQITRIVHRSFIDLVAPVTISAVLIIVAAVLAFLAGRYPSDSFPPLITLALVAVLVVLGAAILLIGIYTFRRNVLIFTNFHLVQVEQPTLFSRQVSQLSFNQVQDATGRRVGFWATVFDYGDIQIQSAAKQEKFTFRRAPHPEQLADDALQTRDQCLRAQGLSIPPMPE